MTANPGAAVKVVSDRDSLAMHTSNMGGLSDTDVNEFAVKPRGFPSGSVVVTTVTPVVKAPKASRSDLVFVSLMISIFPNKSAVAQSIC